ncbi:hypothetical protein TD95_000200 [Thielaviopsis punctulata]|uniref:Mediator of RNA polymerase II transcription subunit 5 n=1 Tax=Thielaviopsis punctulata TaxID=72032 RepID=A0A0F4ZCP6_9PEZI|nr:hypothetical protein TD95_000200 [Thielaviopsis punctulata]
MAAAAHQPDAVPLGDASSQLNNNPPALKCRMTRLKEVVLPLRKYAYIRWKNFMTHMVHNRACEETFHRSASNMWKKHYIPPDALAKLMLAPRFDGYMLDPRTHLYINKCLTLGYLDIPSVLAGQLKYTSLGNFATPDIDPTKEPVTRWKGSFSSDEVLFWRLAKCIGQAGTSPETPRISADVALHTVLRMATWVELFNKVFETLSKDTMRQKYDNNLRAEIESTHAAFVGLLLKVCESRAVLNALDKKVAGRCRRAIVKNLPRFISSIQVQPIAERLNMFRQKMAKYDVKKPVDGEEADDGIDSAASVMALESTSGKRIPPTNSRAGLYIYLNACLVGRPVIDDAILCNWIRNRYNPEIHVGIVDLILASFDVLSNAAFRNEHRSTAQLLRSYLTNKLPLLILNLALGLYPPTLSEFCITTALGQVDPSVFPTLTGMFDDTRNNNDFTENMREEFCFACCLHGLISQANISALLGDTYSSLPAEGKRVKAALVQECAGNSDYIVSLLASLDKTDGNVGAVCEALVEVFGELCANRDTATLKTLCSQLALQPMSLDVIQLFEKPVKLLQPLCHLLDEWRYDDEQTEYQSVYEEFGSVLLLVMVFAYRYNLSPPDMGIRSPDSFVARLIREGHLSKALYELSPAEDACLTGWIHGLFGTDTGGLSDELLASCPPQDFYLLVSTLFKNIVVANSEGCLSMEALKNGIEYLVDTFLMPSLVPAVLFLADQLSVDQEPEQQAMVNVLHMILKPKAIHTNTGKMLAAVKNLTAKPLERALRRYQRRYPTSEQVEPLLVVIKDNIPLSRRTGGADHNELESWCATPGGGLAIAVRSTIQNFVHWSTDPLAVTPTPYTHRQILVAIRRMTAQHVIRLIIDEIKVHMSHGAPALSLMYDVAIALIVSPEVTNYPEPVAQLVDDSGAMPIPTQRRLTLREVLGMKAATYKTIFRTDPVKAEIVLRLHREVEAQMAPAPVPTLMDADKALPLDTGAERAVAGADAVENLVAQAAPVEGLPETLDLMDMSMGDMGMVNGLGGSGSNLDLGTDADLFGGLGGGDDFGWDNIDVMGL